MCGSTVLFTGTCLISSSDTPHLSVCQLSQFESMLPPGASSIAGFEDTHSGESVCLIDIVICRTVACIYNYIYCSNKFECTILYSYTAFNAYYIIC